MTMSQAVTLQVLGFRFLVIVVFQQQVIFKSEV